MATVLAHELAHILMAHGDRFIAPGKKLEDFSDASYEEKLTCSVREEVEKLKNFRVFQAEKYLNDRTKAEAIRNDHKIQRNRFKQLAKKVMALQIL